MNPTQLRFLGYQNTPLLWKENLLGIEQFQQRECNSYRIDQDIDDKLRLGNYVERLVSCELSRNPSITILKENVQIISNKTTLGEIDCLLVDNHQPVHLEIAYKFYLYDPSVGNTFLDHWIGPNRRDSLLLKLNKIKQKQFPLLYSNKCQSLLEELHLHANNVQQRSLFKAQLFVPFQSDIDFIELNEDCIQGFYIHLSELTLFKDCKFYIPKKLDWLMEPHKQVHWMSFEKTYQQIKEFHQKNSAPLCWMKYPNGEMMKLFIVWW